MKLFKLQNYKLIISEEALCIKAFSTIWKRDRSIDKNKAILELGLIYFMFDPRSDYMYIVDENERLSQIIEQEGLPENYEFDSKMIEASEVYKSLINTPATMLLNTAKETIEQVRLFLQNIDLEATDEKGKPKYPINQITSALKDIPTLAKNYDEALRLITLELEENNRIRGQKEKTIFEDGFPED